MSTPNNPPALPSLQQVHRHLLEIDPQLRALSRQPVTLAAERLALDKINTTLQRANDAYVQQARGLYQGLDSVDLTQPAGQQLLSRLEQQLTTQLAGLDAIATVDGQSRKTYMSFTAGISALEQEARLNISDNLLPAAALQMLEDCSRGPDLRPGMYALTFSYQDQTVTFAGACVLTRHASPVVDSLSDPASVGPVLLFTPSRGLEAFDSLSDLDLGLKTTMATSTGRAEFSRHLPVRYQHLDTIEIFPLALQPIEGAPLFEHLYQTLLDKRAQDLSLALSLAKAGQLDATQLKVNLDNAVHSALPDLTLRLDLRAQQLLERDLFNSLPDWYRNASEAQRVTLNQQLRRYNQARQAFLDTFGPAATPHALARHQWAMHLADELDIHDLDPQQLQLTTRRTVANVGTYEHKRSLVELSLRGLHTGDNIAGSDFLEHTTLSYAGAPLDERYSDITPQTLITLLHDLQPRLQFANIQKTALGTPQIKQAARHFFDQRLVAMANLALLQGHLSAADLRLFEQLRETPQPRLCAQTVMLHGAQLKDWWLLREDDANGQPKRLLLCTPDSPRPQQFFAFNSLRECQTRVISWLDHHAQADGQAMANYLLEQVPQRFRPKMNACIQALGFRPDAQEHLKVTFGQPCSHLDCLDAMSAHRLSVQLDDYELSAPPWYRAVSATDRMRLTSLAEDAAGALRTYNARPDSEANFPRFEQFLHAKAKLSLNALLGRTQNDIDPDKVFAYSPKPLVGAGSPPVSYTTLFRDGYEDGVGFLEEKFSASATFRGPPGVDLSPLTAQKVARAVTGVWIGQRYTDEVRTRLQNSDSRGYAERRTAVLAIEQLQLKSSALESRLQGHIASVDLAWLEHAIDSLAQTAGSVRTSYRVHRLTIDGEWVIGNYLFSHADNPVLLYTPDAPDGITFREARLFNYLLKKVDGMLVYWCARVPLRSAARVRLFLETARSGLPDDINRSTPSPARHDSTAHIPPLGDLRHEFYNMSLQRKIDDVTAATVNRTQMITGILWTCIEWVTAVATIPFPLLSLSLGGLLAFKDLMLALSAYHERDMDGALEHYIGFLANFAGSVLFDVRPALKGAFKAFRPVIRTGSHAVQSAMIGQLDNLSAESMQPVVFSGQPMWVPKTPDALGRHVLYRLDPQTGQMRSTARLVNQQASGEWVRSGVAGGGRKGYATLTEEPSTALDIFEVKGDDATNMRALLDPAFKERLPGAELGLDDVVQGNALQGMAPLRNLYAQKVEQLSKDATAFFQNLPPRAPKAPVPVLATDASHSAILSTLFGRDKRLIIGAANHAVASKQLLIEQLPTLAEKGLKRVYIENLPRDLFQNKLKKLNDKLPGKNHALQKIEQHLKQVDQALGYAPDAPFTYTKLLHKTQQLNIAIDGLDAAASYHMEHVLLMDDGPRFIPRSSALRNFYSHRVIEQTTRNNPGEGWVALVETNRLGTYEHAVSLADLNETLTLRVEDAAPGQRTGVWPDTATSAQSRGDYTLSMPTTQSTLHTPGPSAQAPAAVTHYAQFDLPQAIRNDIDLIRQSRRGLDTHYAHANPAHQAAQNAFSQTRRRLLDAAKTHFTDLTLPPRGSLADLAAASNETAFIERLYQQKLGLIIGEGHGAQSSKRLLMDWMKPLKKQGVRTLYMEHLLTDLHQEALDTYQRTLKMPAILKNYLLTMDAGHMPRYHGPYTFTQVVKAANKYGLRVRALDCTASYHVKGLSGDGDRARLFSYFANEVIKADQLAQGPHKWVAFMGSAHTDLYLGVPGVVQLQDAVSLHVRDTAPALARPLHAGGWQSIDEGQGPALRSDFKIEAGIAGRPTPHVAPRPDRSRLTEPGQFIIERPNANEVNLVHFSRSNEILITPIQIDEHGQYFIERWDVLKPLRFHYLAQLVEALKSLPPRGMGLKHVG